MKIIKRIFIITLLFATALSCIVFSSAETNSTSSADSEYYILPNSDSDFIASEEEAYAFAGFTKEFLERQRISSGYFTELISSYPTNESGDTIYPDYYGGGYIDDAGDWIIYIAENNSTIADARKEIERVTGTSDFKTIRAAYSYNELTKMMDYLNEIFTSDRKNQLMGNISGYYLSDSDNCIFVEMIGCNGKSTDVFRKNVVDSPMIKFMNVKEKGIALQTNIYVGQYIAMSAKSASFGYRAKRGDEIGFVTAAHFAANSASIKVSSGTVIGTVTKRQLSGSVDAEFVKISNSSYTPTNTLYTSTATVSTALYSPKVGDVVNQIGQVTGNTSGKIISINVTADSDGVSLTNITSAKYSAKDGDSGGLVYYLTSSAQRNTVGIHMGIDKSDSTIVYFCKADKVNSALGTTRYRRSSNFGAGYLWIHS